MRKSIWIIIIVVLFLMTACKSEEVKIVEQQISSIGNVTEESEELIQNVRQAYNNLSEKDKEAVSNYSELEKAELAFNFILSDKVDKLIEAIGSINDESKAAIDLARSEYDKLTKAQKSIVNYFGDLIAIEKEYDAYIINKSIETLKALKDISTEDSEAIERAEAIYEELTAEQKNEVTKSIKDIPELIQNAKLQRVMKFIDRITYTKDEPKIEDLTAMIDATIYYLKLNEDMRPQILNDKVLKKALDGFSDYMQKRAKTDKVYIRDCYIQQSDSIAYEDLLNYPKSYEGRQLNFEVQILEIKEGLLILSDSMAVTVVGTENLLELRDHRLVKEPLISVEDTLTIYGTFEGTKTINVTEEGSGLWGTNLFKKSIDEYEIPIIEFIYTSNDNLGVIASGDPNATDVGISPETEELIGRLNELIEQMH
ncbi:MAG: hypothetical protein JXQ26_11595 [Tissierellales bacterium]|nr:hypothetical protein [Tissierellales bacterium]MBN2828630.1 hypothetical protein [Tissierellales bacterium]